MKYGKKLLAFLVGHPKIDFLLVVASLLGVYAGFAIVLHTPRPFASVASSSMKPSLALGDLVIVKKIPHSEIKQGDTILFTVPEYQRANLHYPSRLVHRVIRVEKDPAAGLVFWTKGDAVEQMDPFGTPADLVQGKVWHSLPAAGYALLFFQTLYGWIFLGATFFLFFIYDYGKKISKGVLSFFSPKTDPALLERLDKMGENEKKKDQTLSELTGAISQYGEHLKTHIAVMQSIAENSRAQKEATEELRKAAELLAQTVEKLNKKE